MWGRIKERLYWWYLFSKTKVVVDVLIKLGGGALTCVAYIFVVFIVIIWLFMAGKRT